MVRAVREMTSDAPEEIGIERFIAAQAHRAAAREAGFLHDDKGEEDEEQFELMRRSLSKKERKGISGTRMHTWGAIASTEEWLRAFDIWIGAPRLVLPAPGFALLCSLACPLCYS